MGADCVEFCKALADDTRLKILQMLMDDEQCVSDIVGAFSISQPTISHHLNVLRRAGLITSRKEGKMVYYTANRDYVMQCCGHLVNQLEVEEVAEA